MLMGPTLPYTWKGPQPGRPAAAAWGLAKVGASPRAVEAQSLTLPPLPRVKFLLMDSKGSPQAQTRWSDPITLRQGSAGGGVLQL